MTTPANRPLPLPTFGNAPQQYDQQWMSALLAALSRKIGLLAGPNTIQQQILLQSPDGTVYAVTVDNTGTLVRTVVDRSNPHIQPPF